MQEGRSLFASTVIDRKIIYVYGGISGNKIQVPSLANNAFERYDSQTNTWSSFIVEGTPKLSAFGWSLGLQNHEIYILGGSDGGVLQSTLWKIDINARKA